MGLLLASKVCCLKNQSVVEVLTLGLLLAVLSMHAAAAPAAAAAAAAHVTSFQVQLLLRCRMQSCERRNRTVIAFRTLYLFARVPVLVTPPDVGCVVPKW
jgi:hypothetical protein